MTVIIVWLSFPFDHFHIILYTNVFEFIYWYSLPFVNTIYMIIIQ